MKWLCISLLCFSQVFAEFSLNTEQTEEYVLFRVETVEEKSSICALVIHDLEMKAPFEARNGLISLQIAPDPEGLHLFAFGKRKGYFSFAKGGQLPALKPGPYEVRINGFQYGVIYVE